MTFYSGRKEKLPASKGNNQRGKEDIENIAAKATSVAGGCIS